MPQQQNLTKKYSFRLLLSSAIKGLGIFMLSTLVLFGRIFGLKTSGQTAPRALYQVIGILTGFLVFLIVLLYWRGWTVLPILLLHTWAMLLFTKTEVFLRIDVGRFLRLFTVILQLRFIGVLIFIEFKISLPVVFIFWLLTKVAERLVFTNIFVYAYLMSQDRFDAYYWWRKELKPQRWLAVLEILVKRRQIDSLLEIVWQFIRANKQAELQTSYAPVMFSAWVLLRKYQILPDDLVLTHRQLPSKKTGLPPNDYLIGFAVNFKAITYLIEQAKQREPYHALFEDFLNRLQITLENYIQKPFKLTIDKLPSPDFVNELDYFLAIIPPKIESESLREKFSYCYGLFYLMSGIAKNM